MIDKLDPGRENRTFKTRLQFIAGVFAHPHSPDEVLASGVQFRLRKSYESYVAELDRFMTAVGEKDDLADMKKLYGDK